MKNFNFKRLCRGQSTMEYMMIVAVVAVLVFAGFNKLLPAITGSQTPQYDAGGQYKNDTGGFYTQVSRVIQGEHPNPIHGGWCPCGAGQKFTTCNCPAPAFGGNYCPAGGEVCS